MKAKFLPLLLLAILLQVSMFSFANEMTSARRIRLKNKTEVQHRSIPVTPDACIENSLLMIVWCTSQTAMKNCPDYWSMNYNTKDKR